MLAQRRLGLAARHWDIGHDYEVKNEEDGHWLQSDFTRGQKVSSLLGAGALGIIAGMAWHPWFPVNKPLWTSSYVLLTGGVSTIAVALCYQVGHTAGWTIPFRVFGANALIVYIAAELAARAMDAHRWTFKGH